MILHYDKFIRKILCYFRPKDTIMYYIIILKISNDTGFIYRQSTYEMRKLWMSSRNLCN